MVGGKEEDQYNSEINLSEINTCGVQLHIVQTHMATVTFVANRENYTKIKTIPAPYLSDLTRRIIVKPEPQV